MRSYSKETDIRSEPHMRRKWKPFFCAVFAAIFLPVSAKPVLGVQAETSEIKPSDLYAQSAVLMDADSGRILYAKSGQKERPMASTTKIMTCILALENGNLSDIVTVSGKMCIRDRPGGDRQSAASWYAAETPSGRNPVHTSSCPTDAQGGVCLLYTSWGSGKILRGWDELLCTAR